MCNKIYNIELDGKLIGTTKFTKADVPMGVVFGEIKFTNLDLNYNYLLNYCKERKILITEYPEDKFFQTHESIEGITVYNLEGIKIIGAGNQLTIIENETNEISIQGIPYPFYEEEFPHHVKAYKDKH